MKRKLLGLSGLILLLAINFSVLSIQAKPVAWLYEAYCFYGPNGHIDTVVCESWGEEACYCSGTAN